MTERPFENIQNLINVPKMSTYQLYCIKKMRPNLDYTSFTFSFPFNMEKLQGIFFSNDSQFSYLK